MPSTSSPSSRCVPALTQQTGLITYFYKTPAGWRQPEMQHVYDLALPSDAIELKPEDGEAESFELLDVPAVLERLHRGEFKANCALGTWPSGLTRSPRGLFHPPRLRYHRERAALCRDRRAAAHQPAAPGDVASAHTCSEVHCSPAYIFVNCTGRCTINCIHLRDG